MNLKNQEERQIDVLKSLTQLQANEEFIVCLYGREIHKFKRTFAGQYNVGSAAAANIRKDLEGSYRSIGLTNQRFVMATIPDDNPDTVLGPVVSLFFAEVSSIKIKGLIQKHVYIKMKSSEEYHLLFPKYYVGQPSHGKYLSEFLQALRQLQF